MDRPAFEQGSPTSRTSVGFDRNIFDVIHEFAGEAIRFGTIKNSIDLPRGRGHVGLTKFRSRFDERLEHGFEIKCRTANYLEQVGGGGLLLQRLTQFVEQSRFLDGSRGLLFKRFVTLSAEALELCPAIRSKGFPARRCANFGFDRPRSPVLGRPPASTPSHVCCR